MLAQGDSLMKAGKPQRAMEIYEKVVNSDPSAIAFLARAKAYDSLDRSDRFLLDVEQALRLDSTLAEAHFLRSQYALRAQDMHRAVHHAGKALDHSTDENVLARSRIIRGIGNADLKRTELAITDLEQGLAQGVDDVEAMRTLARLYDSAGRYEDALKLLEGLSVLEPNDVGHWSNRAFELIQLGRHPEALKIIEQALKIDKDEPVALSNRAFIYYHMGKDREAMQDVERSLNFYPANAYALRTRALLRLRKGDTVKACEDLALSKVLANIPEVNALLKEHCADQTGR